MLCLMNIRQSCLQRRSDGLSMIEREIMLDTTRLVSRAWTRRLSTGIDRVCEAYCRHFRSVARAVVQHRGIVRVLNASDSQDLFDMLLEPGSSFRRKMLRFAPMALTRSPSIIDGQGAIYLNTSHTDFDLAQHHEWVAQCDLRAVYFLHDLIPLTHPKLTSAHAAKRHLGRVRGIIRHGFGAIVNTHATEQEFRSFAAKRNLDVPPVVAAPLAGGYLSDAARTHCPSVDCKDVPYFACVGTIEHRKNYSMLLRVWEQLEQRLGSQCPHLLIAGQLGPQSEVILQTYRSKPRLHNLVRFETQVSDVELSAIVKSARALLMPTHAEGFGLPVIEALQLGTPVIASDIPSFREIGQGIPLLLDNNDEQAWLRNIEQFAYSNEQRNHQRKMMAGFTAPTWSKHFSILEPWLNWLVSTGDIAMKRAQS